MHRRAVLAAVGGTALPLVSGCLTDPGADGGVLEVLETEAPPSATVIDGADDRVRTVEPIQDGLRRAASASSSVAEIEVTDREFDAVAPVLSELPWYDRTDHGSDHLSGTYFRAESGVYVVVLTPFCTDSRIVNARSERGEYGWGGCYDPEDWGRQ